MKLIYWIGAMLQTAVQETAKPFYSGNIRFTTTYHIWELDSTPHQQRLENINRQTYCTGHPVILYQQRLQFL